MTRQSVTPEVLAYLTQNQGREVTTDALMKATSLERAQIQSAISRLVQHNGLPITTVVRGSMYRYENEGATKPADSETPRTYTEVGVTRNDEIIIRDENGTLYKLADL